MKNQRRKKAKRKAAWARARGAFRRFVAWIMPNNPPSTGVATAKALLYSWHNPRRVASDAKCEGEARAGYRLRLKREANKAIPSAYRATRQQKRQLERRLDKMPVPGWTP